MRTSVSWVVSVAIMVAAGAVALAAPVWLAGEAMLDLLVNTVTFRDASWLADDALLVPYWLTYESNSAEAGFGSVTVVGLFFGVFGVLMALAFERPVKAWRRTTVGGFLLLEL